MSYVISWFDKKTSTSTFLKGLSMTNVTSQENGEALNSCSIKSGRVNGGMAQQGWDVPRAKKIKRTTRAFSVRGMVSHWKPEPVSLFLVTFLIYLSPIPACG